jgi:magnesium and cobalt exporter, CNNM family
MDHPWLIVIITLIFSAFFSGLEIAFVSSNKLKIEVDKSQGSLSAKILSHFITIPSRFIGALLLGNNVSLVIYGMAMTIMLQPLIAIILPEAINQEYLSLFIKTIIRWPRKSKCFKMPSNSRM